MPSPLVYVAGPMTIDPYGCVRQAVVAFRHLRAAGLTPFLPQLSVLHEMIDPQPYEDWMAYDFDVISNVAAVFRLIGESKGADREVEYARSLDIPVFFQHTAHSLGLQAEVIARELGWRP